MCFLPNCRYHILLIGKLKELLQKLDSFCFNYLHGDCLYTLFKYRFSGKNDVRRRQLFDIKKQRAVHFNHQNRGVTDWPASRKKALEEEVQKTFVELLPKDYINTNGWISFCRKKLTS